MTPFPEVWILDPEIAPVALIIEGTMVCAATPATTCAELDTVPPGSNGDTWADADTAPLNLLVILL
jgi:hypothetical protein